MEWAKIENRLWRADGKYGYFFIEQSGKTFWSKYKAKNGRVVKMPPKQTIKEAKSMCENNYYWEVKNAE